MNRDVRSPLEGVKIRHERNRTYPYRWSLTRTWPDDGIGTLPTHGGADSYEEAVEQALEARRLHEAEASKGKRR